MPCPSPTRKTNPHTGAQTTHHHPTKCIRQIRIPKHVVQQIRGSERAINPSVCRGTAMPCPYRVWRCRAVRGVAMPGRTGCGNAMPVWGVAMPGPYRVRDKFSIVAHPPIVFCMLVSIPVVTLLCLAKRFSVLTTKRSF